MMNWMKLRLRRFKHDLQMDIYLLFHNPLKSKPININVHAVCDYARSVGKPVDQLTEEEVRPFYIK